MKDLLRRLFAATLRELDAGKAMAPVLARYRKNAANGGRFLVLAYGKAAQAMVTAVIEQLPGARLRGLAVVPEGGDAPLPPLEVIVGGHPLPTEGSLRAGKRALELARSVEADETVLFLASGGGSAMLEWPLVDAVTLGELQALYRALVGSGAGIIDVNAVRKHVSAVKGGRLALAAAAAREHVTITINDLHLDFPSHVASGPSLRDPCKLAQCIAVLDEFELWPAVPERLRQPLREGSLPRGLVRDTAYPTPAFVADVLDNSDARRAFARRARAAGIHPVVDVDPDDVHFHEPPWQRASRDLVNELERLHRRWPGRRVAILSGGELSVPLPANPGIGGRNQQFVLACARLIRGRPITVLSAGTDGVDGNSPAAGALADGHTMSRARKAGLDVHAALRRCDAFPLLHALGDAIVTGPTGTNVRDLRVLVHHG